MGGAGTRGEWLCESHACWRNGGERVKADILEEEEEEEVTDDEVETD